ncbi:MAG: FkbM family methyltransferase, partial [Acidimicrobiales bacterium]
SRSGRLDLVVPALDGRALTALATGAQHPSIAGIASNVVDYAARYGGERLTLHRFAAPISRLDDELASGGFRVPVSNVVAIKVDAEGMEDEVLTGASRILQRHRPLVMAEGGHHPGPRAVMEALGFKMAELAGDVLRPVPAPTQSVNAWYFHPSRIAEYHALGLLAP